jgi:hypothetical protein
MDQLRLEVIRDLVSVRAMFFRNPNVYRRRDDITLRYLEIELRYLELLTRQRAEPVTITFPINLPSNFLDVVPIVPTPEQIENELIDGDVPVTPQNCSICQDSISSECVRLRICQHAYHRSCIQTWFGASVRCPVCRRDIREDPAIQTSSAATRTQPLRTSPWGGEDIPE